MNDYQRPFSALCSLDPGCDRDTWLKILMAAKAAGITKENALKWSQPASNFESEKSFSDVWKSIDKDGPVTAGTLYHLARGQGWREPQSGGGQIAFTSRNNKPAKDEHRKPKKIWALCVPATADEPYIAIKQGIPDGIKVYPVSAPPLIINGQDVRGYLALPCWDGDALQTIQFIPPKGGNKLNLTGSSFGDGFFTVGEIVEAGLIYIGEGIGVAWSAYKATGAASVACFGSGRMMTVAKVLREKYLSMRLVVVPDRGKEKEAVQIALAVGGQWIELPGDMPENDDANDYALEFGLDVLEALLAFPRFPEMRFKLLSGDDLCNAPPMRWIIRGVLPAEGLAALFGPSGSGKSFLAMDMGGAIAAGFDDWFGLRITQAPVTYVCLEGEAGIGKRVKAWKLRHKMLFFPDGMKFIISQPFNLLSDDDVSELAKAVIAAGGAGGLIIIDTLNRATPGSDENSSMDTSKVIAASTKLQNITGGLVLFVHHPGKDPTKGMRGHTSLPAALDGAIEVAKPHGHREWIVAKSKDDVSGNSYPFKLEIVSLGLDDEGLQVTSCVAVPNEGVDCARRRALPPNSSNQKIIWEALTKGDLFLKSTDYGQGGAPAETACIRLGVAIEQTKGRLPCEQKRQSERTQSAISGLVARGLLGHQDGWVWVI